MKKNKSNTTNNKNGFTLIELSIAVVFVSVLLILIFSITMSTITIYQKGIAIKTINSIGPSIIDDIKRSIANTPTEDLSDLCVKIGKDEKYCQADLTKEHNWFDTLIYHQKYNANNEPTSGVFCTGNYSYIWNTSYANDSNRARINNDSNFNLKKFPDPMRRACSNTINGDTINLSGITNDIELIVQDEVKLALYNFVIYPPAIDEESMQTLYTGSFLLSRTSDPENALITLNEGEYCNNDKMDNITSAYCAINKFNFAARATGE